ncbi:hypothetical protein LC612_39660 [Nostoc sp. CHAB 5834]|nr:hypothetical protein [Nostoc sp. CHAB 5834]
MRVFQTLTLPVALVSFCLLKVGYSIPVKFRELFALWLKVSGAFLTVSLGVRALAIVFSDLPEELLFPNGQVLGWVAQAFQAVLIAGHFHAAYVLRKKGAR